MTKARNSGMPRERRLSSFIHRVSPGKLLALFFIARATSFFTGCGDDSSAGKLGGKCIQSCSDQLHCDDGLICEGPDVATGDADNAVCTQPEPDAGPSQGPSGYGPCDIVSSPECDESEAAFSCPAGNTSSLPNAVCRPIATDVFCCENYSITSDAGTDSSVVDDASTDDASDADVIDADASDQ